MTIISRRDLLCSSLAGACYQSLAAFLQEPALTGPLGFQIYSVRALVAKDMPGTLKRVAAMGYTVVELCSFKGFAGDTKKGDFGPLADLTAAEIRKTIRDAGMTTTSCHFNPLEFDDPNIDRSIAWAAEVGIEYMTVGPPILPREPTMEEWHQTFLRLNRQGERLRKAGRQLGYHPQADAWKEIGGVMIFDEMLRSVDPKNCQFELDISASHVSGVDAGAYMAAHPGRFFAVHLRDLKIPPKPVPYIFSLPLGQGEVDWKKILSGAKKGAVGNLIVEMVVQPPADPLAALRISAEYLRSLKA